MAAALATRAVPLKYSHGCKRAAGTISLVLDFSPARLFSPLSDFSRGRDEPFQRLVLVDAGRDFDLDAVGIHAAPFCFSYPIADT